MSSNQVSNNQLATHIHRHTHSPASSCCFSPPISLLTSSRSPPSLVLSAPLLLTSTLTITMAAPCFTTLFACVLLLAAFSGAAAEDKPSEHVHVLSADFDDQVNDGNVWFIKVRSASSGTCRGAQCVLLGTAVRSSTDLGGLLLLCLILCPSAVLRSLVR